MTSGGTSDLGGRMRPLYKFDDDHVGDFSGYQPGGIFDHETIQQQVNEAIRRYYMDPKERLKELEAKIVETTLQQLEQMLKRDDQYFGSKSNLEHCHEAVKLAFQVRALLGLPT